MRPSPGREYSPLNFAVNRFQFTAVAELLFFKDAGNFLRQWGKNFDIQYYAAFFKEADTALILLSRVKNTIAIKGSFKIGLRRGLERNYVNYQVNEDENAGEMAKHLKKIYSNK